MNEQPKKDGESRIKVFVVQTEFASPNRIDESKEISEMKREIDFTFPKLIRNQISATREKHMKFIRDCTVEFPPDFKAPLHLCNEQQKNEIKERVTQAEKEFQEINKGLHAQIVFVELNIHDVQRGELIGQVIAAIRYKVMYSIIEKIGEKVGQLPDTSRTAILKLIDRLKYVNILKDPEVDMQIDSIRESILSKDIELVKADLVKDLNFTKSRMTYVDLS